MSLCVLGRAKHSFFALPGPFSCFVINKICLNQSCTIGFLFLNTLIPIWTISILSLQCQKQTEYLSFYFLFKYDLHRSNMHVEFNLTGV